MAGKRDEKQGKTTQEYREEWVRGDRRQGEGRRGERGLGECLGVTSELRPLRPAAAATINSTYHDCQIFLSSLETCAETFTQGPAPPQETCPGDWLGKDGEEGRAEKCWGRVLGNKKEIRNNVEDWGRLGNARKRAEVCWEIQKIEKG